MNLPVILNSIDNVLKEIQINEILNINKESQKYGLYLNTAEVEEIIETRNHVLPSYGRVELDMGVISKLIKSLCNSPYISQEDYVSTLNDLQEMFYYLKNETEDKIGDDELIDILMDLFNNSCRGAMELLQGIIEKYGADIRYKNYINDYLLKGEEY